MVIKTFFSYKRLLWYVCPIIILLSHFITTFLGGHPVWGHVCSAIVPTRTRFGYVDWWVFQANHKSATTNLFPHDHGDLIIVMVSNFKTDDMPLPISGKPIEADLWYCDRFAANSACRLGGPGKPRPPDEIEELKEELRQELETGSKQKIRHVQKLKFRHFGSSNTHMRGSMKVPIKISTWFQDGVHCRWCFLHFALSNFSSHSRFGAVFCKMQHSLPDFTIQKCKP